MKQTYKNSLRRVLVRVYSPCIYRIEKIRASLMWRRGVSACIRKRKKHNKPRFYMLFDSNTMHFVSMTYNPVRDAVSVRSLLRMGKLHVHRSPSVSDIKRECFYYTDSLWGAPQCDPKQKLAEWLRYYLAVVSPSIRKLNAYKKKYSL